MKSWGCGCAAFIGFVSSLHGGAAFSGLGTGQLLANATDRVPPILYAGPRPPSLLGRT